MLLQCALTSKARGALFLVALATTALASALMWDGLITELYGLAFVPLYGCLLVGFADMLSRGPRFAFDRDTYVPAAAPAAMLARIFTFMVWVVLLVLLPLILAGVKTVDATAIAGVFVLWVLAVLAAQLSPGTAWLRPLSLRAIADYLSAPPPEEVLGREIETNFELPEAPPNLEEDAFDQYAGTQRHMSVSESLRGSPPRDLELEAEEDALGFTGAVTASATVFIPERPADAADFDPERPGALEEALRG